MQIRLTVLGPRSGPQSASACCDVLVTAPTGTPLAAVASALAATVGGPETPAGTAGGRGGAVVLYSGPERLDPQRHTLGEPPLVDGAVVSLYGPAAGEEPGQDAPAQLHVIGGPDAGGVHLLHGGPVRIGRSTDADVPLDDPDVSRLHCAVTLGEDGRVTVVDLGSTNGTAVDGRPVGSAPVPLPPGALLSVGESLLRLAGPAAATLTVTPDLEGRLRIGPTGSDPAEPTGPGGPTPTGPGAGAPPRASGGVRLPAGAVPTQGGPAGGGAFPGTPAAAPAGIDGFPVQGGTHGGSVRPAPVAPVPAGGYETGGHGTAPEPRGADGATHPDPYGGPGAPEAGTGHDTGTGTGTDAAPARRGFGAWARRRFGGGEREAEAPAGAPAPGAPVPGPVRADGRPDPAALLLAALGPGPLLWERGPGHPEALLVRLGNGSPVPLLESGALGLAGPRPRLAGLARSVIAQLAALHSPQDLELVLISTDRARPVAERRADWSWLGWLPHVRPRHGQDCRLLLAFDRDQAAARTAELTRRLDDGPLGAGWASADRAAVAGARAAYRGPYTVVVLDGDPGPGPLRDLLGRLAGHGPAAGIHLVCLAETPSASPASPVAETYEAACAASPAFRDCGTAALLSGDVATALRVLPVSGGRPAGHGETVVADGVSAAWAERFARALAPLRGAEGGTGSRRSAAALPPVSRLLDELGLARATPASLMARWAAATDRGQSVGGLAELVLGGGRSGPVGVELVADGPHLIVEGPAGSGRTELLRAVAASLASAARPDRLGLLLVDGAGGERGEGLAPCTELPHVAGRLAASDPVRMREFAQALGAELKRRAELLAGVPFAEWHARQEVSGRLVAPRRPGAAELRGDLDPARSGTLRLRAGTAPGGPVGPDPLPRLVVLVDDFDALVAPALGSPGRPAAGSVVRALEAVAREGGRLGVHLVASTARPERTADSEPARLAGLRVELAAPPSGPDEGPDRPAPGRGVLRYADGRSLAFQGGRVTGRIPRTATLRPTVVPLEWERMGDPPTRRPVRELGNGPTDLALLASALDRAADLVAAAPVLFPATAPEEAHGQPQGQTRGRP
ncbi:FHA domain-containing protein [Streptomyces sp. NPDC097619]|uniref:FHA domain-containing protein n=1 Tax=Streptomyces sp. NPDC097619 TaxID=3157228 RepID=UPI00331DEDA1